MKRTPKVWRMEENDNKGHSPNKGNKMFSSFPLYNVPTISGTGLSFFVLLAWLCICAKLESGRLPMLSMKTLVTFLFIYVAQSH